MADPKTIKEAFERNKKAVKLRPSTGQSTGNSTIRVKDGTTCEIEGSGWKLTADMGTKRAAIMPAYWNAQHWAVAWQWAMPSKRL